MQAELWVGMGSRIIDNDQLILIRVIVLHMGEIALAQPIAQHEIIMAFIAAQGIALPCNQHIIACATVQKIDFGIIIAKQRVISKVTIQRIGPGAAAQCIIAEAAIQPIITRAARQVILPLATHQRVCAVAAAQRIIPLMAGQFIPAQIPPQEIVTAFAM